MIWAVVALAAAATVLRSVSSSAEVRISPNRVLVTARAASAVYPPRSFQSFRCGTHPLSHHQPS
jgi:hypothetical protein